MRLIDIEPYERISPYTLIDFKDGDNGWIYTKDIPTITIDKDTLQMKDFPLKIAVSNCAESNCCECPYLSYNSDNYPNRCIHILIRDIDNELSGK